MDTLSQLWSLTAFPLVTWQMMVMWVVIGVLLYLAVYKNFEPLLLVPIAFGALLANLPTQGIINPPDPVTETVGGLFHYISMGVHLEIFPPLIFLGVGALTDFGPLIANPRVLILGAAAQGPSCWASRRNRPGPSASSAGPMGRHRSSSPTSWLRNCWLPSRWRHTATWRWCR
jgi:Na+-transporting methylmalonyl-CoA/oxaloacetate decarboxylase beta subunit